MNRTAALIALSLVAAASPASARITGWRVTAAGPAFGGASFGTVGPYQEIRGVAYGVLDPSDPRNAVITDIALAPKNVLGGVEYSMDFAILTPLDPSRGNHTLLFDVVNRGRRTASQLNVGASDSDPGDGFLEAQGYAIVASGWEGDIASGIRINLPVARNPDGSEITGRVRAEYILSAPAAAVDVTSPPTYEAALTDNADAVLTRRRRQDDPRETIPNDQWAFAQCTADAPFPGTPDPRRVCLKGGFDTDHIYELVYTAKNPTVTGIGFAASRDFMAFLHYYWRDSMDRAPAGPVDAVIVYGTSQSGRWVRSFVDLGFNEDEIGRRVADGVIPHKASNRGAFNVRFGQPIRYAGTQHTEKEFPGQESPQTWDVTSDPIAGVTGGQLERCRRSNTCPKILQTMTDTEYWQALMALNTTDAWGKRDLEMPPEVRVYHFAGTQHVGGDPLKQPPAVEPKPPKACQLPANTNAFLPQQRALLVALRQWILAGTEPPSSRYPTLAHGSLVPASAIKVPYVPAQHFALSALASERFHLDRGPAFDEKTIAGVMAEPPRKGEPYALLLPQVDSDGNPVDGLRNTTIEVPLGTYTGWNVRKAGFSEGDSCDLAGAFIPFFRTKPERLAAGDPRPSLEERYPTHADYVAKVEAAAKILVADRLLLAPDSERIVAQAQAAAVP